MKIAFDALQDQSKIWIYQAASPLAEDQLTVIKNTLDQFTHSWDSHGAPLQASYKIIDNQFFVIAVDEGLNAASGCSIDKSVAVFKSLEESLGISLLEKANVSFISDDSKGTVNFRNLKESVQNGEITPDTKIYDLTLTSLKDFREGWPRAAKDTWVNRFFSVKTIS